MMAAPKPQLPNIAPQPAPSAIEPRLRSYAAEAGLAGTPAEQLEALIEAHRASRTPRNVPVFYR